MKKILLIDHHDGRRETRLKLFAQAGYDVKTREDYFQAEGSEDEATFDLVIVALHGEDLADAAAYSERLRNEKPALPILLLADAGVFIPRHVLSQSFEAGHPVELLAEIAELLARSTFNHELAPLSDPAKAA
jgi:DNA-binding response OmpR family regulator